MTKDEIRDWILTESQKASAEPVKCWLVTNEMSEERAVFSVEQESIDLLKDLMLDPAYKDFESKRVEGVFLTLEDFRQVVDLIQRESLS
jgi:hypothetical protein